MRVWHLGRLADEEETWGIPEKRSLSVFLPPEGSSHTLSHTHSHAHTHTQAAQRTLRRDHGTVSLTTRMGCNLCTLQKREEHYKLLYEIAQVSPTPTGSGSTGEEGAAGSKRARVRRVRGGRE